MKTLILSLLFTGSSLALLAQVPQNTKDSTDTTGSKTDSVSTMSSTGNYRAYGSVNIPSSIQSSFQSQYPNAGDVTWDMDTATNMWRARYNNVGRNLSVYYNESGHTYSIALPVIQSLVPENVISTVISKYGNNIYDILQLKTSDSQYVYQVRLIEDGQVRAEHMNEDGSAAVMTYNPGTSGNDSTGNWNNNNNNNLNKSDTTNMQDNRTNMNNNSTDDNSNRTDNTNIQDNTGNNNNLNSTDNPGVNTNQSTNGNQNYPSNTTDNSGLNQGTNDPNNSVNGSTNNKNQQ